MKTSSNSILKSHRELFLGSIYDFVSIGSVRLNKQNKITIDKKTGELIILIPSDMNGLQIGKEPPDNIGITFCDGSVLTVEYKITPEWPPPPHLRSIGSKIALRPPTEGTQETSSSNNEFGYISKYSYSFYPANGQAGKIGYFRYDFHPEFTGQNLIADHPYFHLHVSKDEIPRLPTGVVALPEVLSYIEAILSPEQCKARLLKLLNEATRNSLRLLVAQLGPVGFRQLVSTQFSSYKEFTEFKGAEAVSSMAKEFGLPDPANKKNLWW